MTQIELTSDMSADLIDHMGTELSIVNAARVSFNEQSSGMTERDEGLIRFLMKNRHACYDSNTDVLTATGWKSWTDIDGTEEFITLNLETEEIELQRANRVVHEFYDGDMIQMNMNHVDVLVTPNHRMVSSPRTHDNQNVFGLNNASEFHNRSYRLRLGGGEWFGDLHEPEIAALIGFIVADGCVGKTAISFSLSKSRKTKWLTERHKVSVSPHTSPNAKTYRLLEVSEQLKYWAKQTYTETGDRCFPRELLERGDAETLEALLDGYLVGDGSVSPTGKITAGTVSRQLVNDLQELALKIGIAATEIKTTMPGHQTFPNAKPFYRLCFYRDRNMTPRIGWTQEARSTQIKTVPYKGMVHCVTVPNGTLYVRRNGKPMWSGNSPFEHCTITFLIKAPIFVAREWHRHRTQCLPAGTRIHQGGKVGSMQWKPIEQIWENWNEGVPDSLGRRRKLPSVYSAPYRVLNEETLLFESSRIGDIWKTGKKKIVRLVAGDRVLRCSVDHLIFTPNGYVKAGDLSIGDEVGTMGRLPKTRTEPVIIPSLRRGINEWTQQQRKTLIPSDYGVCTSCLFEFPKDDLRIDHEIPIVLDLSQALEISNLKVVCRGCHRIKTSSESKYANRPEMGAGCSWQIVESVTPDGEEECYDIEMTGPWNNFIADGFIVHNSYNEMSGRYTEMEPKFYAPDYDRPLIQKGKPGAYYFEVSQNDEVNISLYKEFRFSCQSAWNAYEYLMAEGVAKEVARMVLPVNIFTSWYATANLRGWINFLSLRAEDHAMYEIRQLAYSIEHQLYELFPVTMEVWDRSGRGAL